MVASMDTLSVALMVRSTAALWVALMDGHLADSTVAGSVALRVDKMVASWVGYWVALTDTLSVALMVGLTAAY